MKCIWTGLTGGPGCGKSEAVKTFREIPGWQCFDTDRICHEIYEENDSPLVRQMESRWGAEVRSADGKPDRKKIAEKIFNNSTEREWLNSILHPEILFRLENKISESGTGWALIEVPLLFEAKFDAKMDKNVAVWSPEETQLERLLARGWTREHAEKRIASQLPAAKKLEMADYGIINRSSLESLREQCFRIAEDIENNYKK